MVPPSAMVSILIGGYVEGDSLKKPKLRSIYITALSALFAACFAVFLCLDVHMNREQAESMLLEEARTFAREMDAVWGFMGNAQYTINNTSNGTYEFKGLHCAIVGKSVGMIFSHGSDYKIRYVNFEPRNILDKPDAYETSALQTFLTDSDTTEHYGFTEVDGIRRFRYVRALQVDESCLECHGEPAGELDITGFPKEGWTLDSVGGAISMIVPTDHQDAAMLGSVARDVAFFFAFTIATGAIILCVTWFFVLRPLSHVEGAFAKLAGGEMGVKLRVDRVSRETEEIIAGFNVMAGELERMYAGLEEQVRERTQDLDAANRALARQRDELEVLAGRLADESSFKTDLLSMVNHELRTPLTSIITLAQVSKATEGAGDDEERRSWSEVENNGTILLEMINNMLDIARGDAGVATTECEPIDLGDVTSSVRSVMAPIALKYKVAFSTSVAPDVPLVLGDYDKTLRIFENLASNAVKFTADGGNARLDVRLDAATGDVHATVSDTGIGIEPEHLGRIFDKFFQVNSTSTRKYNGNGLGLALVKQYVQAQGFRVEVESEPGKGSSFTIVVPSELTIPGEAG